MDKSGFAKANRVYNAAVDRRFNATELSDISSVLGRYSSCLGRLDDYDVKVTRRRRNAELYEADMIAEACGFLPPGDPSKGFVMSDGRVDQDTGTIYMNPKKVIEGYDEWRRSFTGQWKARFGDGRISGEEGKTHDFGWTFAHEMGHLLSVRWKLSNALLNGGTPQDSGFVSDWLKWHRKATESAGANFKAFRDSMSRPEGFPTLYSMQDPLEALADMAAYVVNDYHYADSEPMVSKGAELMKALFEEKRR